MLHLSRFRECFALRRQWLHDHMVEAASSSRGLDVRWITLREEHDTTEHKAMTLLKRKVMARVTENRSC
jgi:hypothetical protein